MLFLACFGGSVGTRKVVAASSLHMHFLFLLLFTQNSQHTTKPRPQQTMTDAKAQTRLSKLDLFTPSPLHPYLPPLTTGLYPAMGATMLSTPHVLARKEQVVKMLGGYGSAACDDVALRKRQARLERIMKHLGIDYVEGEGWVERLKVEWMDVGKGKGKEQVWGLGRKRLLEGELKGEWEALGMVVGGEEFMEDVWRCFGQGGMRMRMRNEGGVGHGESIESPIEIDD